LCRPSTSRFFSSAVAPHLIFLCFSLRAALAPSPSLPPPPTPNPFHPSPPPPPYLPLPSGARQCALREITFHLRR
jgi:hypothetical protein